MRRPSILKTPRRRKKLALCINLAVGKEIPQPHQRRRDGGCCHAMNPLNAPWALLTRHRIILREALMQLIIDQHRAELQVLCQRFQVKTLELFGSATDGRFDPHRSDLDFLVDFLPMPPGPHSKAYFGLLFALEDLFSQNRPSGASSRAQSILYEIRQ